MCVKIVTLDVIWPKNVFIRWYQILSAIYWATRYRVTTIGPLGWRSRWSVLGVRLCALRVSKKCVYKMVSELIHDLLGHPLLGHNYQTTRVMLQISSPECERSVLKVSHWDEIWSENVIVSLHRLHLTGQYCRVDLGPTQTLILTSLVPFIMVLLQQVLFQSQFGKSTLFSGQHLPPKK